MRTDTAPAPDPMPLHGEVGVLAYDEVADRIQCRVCGRWLQKIESRHLALGCAVQALGGRGGTTLHRMGRYP